MPRPTTIDRRVTEADLARAARRLALRLEALSAAVKRTSQRRT